MKEYEAMVNMAISLNQVEEMQRAFQDSSHYRSIQNTVTKNGCQQSTVDWNRFACINHSFSHKIEKELPATAQNKSGRCWLFAFLNQLRLKVADKYQLDHFELSQSYLFFWDKLEKANYFLESVLETVQEEDDSRIIMTLFSDAFLWSDGGQWHMAVNLVHKYGLVPQSVYPDSYSCLDSKEMNQICREKLREWGASLRRWAREGKRMECLRESKKIMLSEMYRILSIHLGTPPRKFDWEFIDSNKAFHVYQNCTPGSFFQDHVAVSLQDFVCLVHSPRQVTPFNQTYTIAHLGNVVSGDPIVYVNVEMEIMKRATMQALVDKQAVWFGCDVRKKYHKVLGVMDTKLYDVESAYQISFSMTKEERMIYGESQMVHAMLFTGVDVVNDKPKKWRVENSWGDKIGDKGYFIMTDNWFVEYMFEVAVEKRFLSQSITALLDQSPVVLPLWDPLGSLAL